MDYKSAKYLIGLLFSEASLFDSSNVTYFDEFINSIALSIGVKLKKEGLIFQDGLKVSKIRRTNISNSPIQEMIQKALHCNKVLFYIADDPYSKENPPKLLINIYGSKDDIFPRIKEKALTFFIFGIRKDISLNGNEFLNSFKSLYSNLNGVIGGIFYNSSYTINSTNIEWAYKNFTFQIQDNGFKNWNPGFDEIFY